MKKHFLTLITALLLLAGGLLVCGCEKEPPPPDEPPHKPPVVEELSPVIEVTVTPEGIVPYGDSVYLRYNNSNTKMFWVDGQKQESPTEGTFISGPICRKTTFWLMATNVELTTKKYLDIREVGPWYETTFGLVSYYPWRYKAMRITSLDGIILDYWIPDPEVLSWIIYYHTNGTVSYSHTAEIVPWFVPNDGTIIINGTTRKLQVNQEQMVVSYQTTYNGELIWFDMVFEHASNTPTDPI